MDTDLLQTVRRELTAQADTRTREGFQAFFKEGIVCYGVKTPAVTKIARNHFKTARLLGKTAVFSLCEDLLKSDYTEEAFIASEWVYWLRDKYEPSDFAVFERWLSRYINNWAKCDSLCNHAIGSFVEQYPQYVDNLKAWTKSENRWVRRGAAVTLILPARHGKFLADVFEIADSLLLDGDDLVQKGYGWMLKEASHQHQQEVFDYVVQHKATMPRTALRYAIEKMPPDLRRVAMAKS